MTIDYSALSERTMQLSIFVIPMHQNNHLLNGKQLKMGQCIGFCAYSPYTAPQCGISYMPPFDDQANASDEQRGRAFKEAF